MPIALTAAVNHHGFLRLLSIAPKWTQQRWWGEKCCIWESDPCIKPYFCCCYGTSPLSFEHARVCYSRASTLVFQCVEVRDVRYHPSSLSTLLFETESLTEPKACWQARVGVQRAPGDPPVSTLQLWDCRHVLPCLVFHAGAGDSNSSPHACGVSALSDDPFP